MLWLGAIITVGLLLVVLVLVRSVLRVMSEHVTHYLPPVSIAKLSKQLQTELLLAQKHNEQLILQYEDLKLASDKLRELFCQADALEEVMLQNVKFNLDTWMAQYGEQLFDRVIRVTSTRLLHQLEHGLLDRTTSLCDRYVVLQSLDDLTLDVRLEARYHDPEDLRAAILKLLEWEPAKARPIHKQEDLGRRFLERTKSRQDLDQFLGKLGEQLLSVSWDGKALLHTRKVAIA